MKIVKRILAAFLPQNSLERWLILETATASDRQRRLKAEVVAKMFYRKCTSDF
jgi:hypothetical protein